MGARDQFDNHLNLGGSGNREIEGCGNLRILTQKGTANRHCAPENSTARHIREPTFIVVMGSSARGFVVPRPKFVAKQA